MQKFGVAPKLRQFKTHCAAVSSSVGMSPCGKLDHKRSRPVPGLNRPKRVRRTDNGIDEPTCLCCYRVWVERGKRRRRPDSGAAYLASVGPVTVLCYPSLCHSSSPRQTYGAADGCSKLLTFQTSCTTDGLSGRCRFRIGTWGHILFGRP